jgi:hypothetical protein
MNLHPELVVEHVPYNDLKHTIFFGPTGVGKYTQMLNMIRPYSPSGLKVEKKLQIDSANIMLKISDIHYEIDLEMIGCNSKQIWNDIYTIIVNIVQCKFPHKHGIIVCKNFHHINRELLDIFYSYIQSPIKFIFLSESISFIPHQMLVKCKVIPVRRPTAEMYKMCLNVTELPPVITNIKSIIHGLPTTAPHVAICNKLLEFIQQSSEFSMNEIREDLYSVLVYNLGVDAMCIHFITNIQCPMPQKMAIVKETVLFLQYFNNNYRPIYHLEKYVYTIMCILKNDIDS